MWPPKAALLAKLKPGLAVLCLESISSASMKSLSKNFSLLRSVMTLHSELQEKQLPVNVYMRLQLRPSLHTTINHQKLCPSEDSGTNC